MATNNVPSGENANPDTCSICYNEIPSENCPSYGVLTDCDHIFCYGCITTWKNYCNVPNNCVSCPMCRTISTFIFRSEYFPKDRLTKYMFLLMRYCDLCYTYRL
ncbi:E3 ubiquitin-protein ligase makorin-2-like isoform X1 [Aethina tumida]|uniref:E3 ubiquitin-protein ligase makorin-2-like isoform X1 n=1 Tax=Aethina tumida TaxID=116153 RepID=UPI002148A6BF|nr:E3 ubiquitin-protein ligase makorin-2-like isoform X1 [Aethina tumida]